jgi:hypothetical protein
MALQRMIDAEPKQTIMLLSQWAEANDPLVLRAVVAGVAEPRLLRNDEVARSALRLHRRVLERLPGLQHEADDFKSLKKSLGYSLSVVVVYSPKEGFALMEELARSKDRDINWIIRENLTKKRMMRYPREMDAIKRLMSAR